MSGHYGWDGSDHHDSSYDGGGFTRAHSAYSSSSYTAPKVETRKSETKETPFTRPFETKSRDTSRSSKYVDFDPRRKQKTTKKNVLILSIDMTGSMGQWREEILDRCAMLYKEAQGYVGEELEILFTVFGDTPCCNDKVEVAPLGSGPELENYLQAFGRMQGGPNDCESAELPALYVLRNLDTSSAQSVYFFTITDELAYETPKGYEVLGISGQVPTTKDLFTQLKVKMGTYLILADVGNYSSRTLKFWEETIGKQHIAMLDDARRCVDVILGIVAKVSGQYEEFTRDLTKRQKGTEFGDINISTVLNATSLIEGGPMTPTVAVGEGTKSLLDPSVMKTKTLTKSTKETKSLLD